jgi:hypothetical protein
MVWGKASALEAIARDAETRMARVAATLRGG